MNTAIALLILFVGVLNFVWNLCKDGATDQRTAFLNCVSVACCIIFSLGSAGFIGYCIGHRSLEEEPEREKGNPSSEAAHHASGVEYPPDPKIPPGDLFFLQWGKTAALNKGGDIAAVHPSLTEQLVGKAILLQRLESDTGNPIGRPVSVTVKYVTADQCEPDVVVVSQQVFKKVASPHLGSVRVKVTVEESSIPQK